MLPLTEYVSCQKPVPPESRRKSSHHCRCGSDRAMASSDGRSRQYRRIPMFIGKDEAVHGLVQQQPVRPSRAYDWRI
jgi:hypothetical protein